MVEIDVRALLTQHNLFAKKRLGQNFLTDANVLERIVDAVERQKPPSVIEIGPGLGSLTARLLARGFPVVAVEIDRELVPILESIFAGVPNFRVVQGDATEVDLGALHTAGPEQPPGTPVGRPHVVGNLPYQVTTPLLLALLRQRHALGPATVMVQREVADRLLADPDQKAYGSLTVLFQLYAELDRVRDVPPTCFRPEPKVFSTVLSIRWRDTPQLELSDPLHFERVVRASFGQRRKTLRNALKAEFTPEFVSNAETTSGLDFGRRAETFSIAEFGVLAAALPAR